MELVGSHVSPKIIANPISMVGDNDESREELEENIVQEEHSNL